MKTFSQWMVSEARDIFGFEKEPETKKVGDEYDGPIMPINAEELIEEMLKRKINGMEPFSAYADQIQWGRNPGAVRMVISPLGSFKSIIRKLHTNLLGEDAWVCKKIIPYKDISHSNFRFDAHLAQELMERTAEVYGEEVSSPDSEYSGLEALSIKIYNASRRKGVLPKIFIPRGIKMIRRNENYLIYFECSGQGVETPGSGRLEVFIMDMSYDRETGMIRSFGHDVQSKTKGHVWYPQPSEWDEVFSPSQSENEIVEAVSKALSTY